MVGGGDGVAGGAGWAIRTLRAYLVTTGAVFGLIVAAHVIRLLLEGPQLAMDPWFILLTVAAGTLSVWGLYLARRSGR